MSEPNRYINLEPGRATSSGHPSRRTITERINGADVIIEFEYNFAGEVTVLENTFAGDLWELESKDVQDAVERAASASLARDGRL